VKRTIVNNLKCSYLLITQVLVEAANKAPPERSALKCTRVHH